ncbi:ATP-binding protein [Cyanobacteria bacterium FACHB-472]|nr:ATP-binding protein [Cyanobacteria bacterium FACHB-472]
MNISALSNRYQANFQNLLASVNRVRQLLENHISRLQQQSAQAESEQQLAPESVAAESIPEALEQLCTIFNLSPFERDILLLCAGMELDPNLKFLCANAQGIRELNYPTFSLALSVLPNSHWSVLASQSPLQRWQLIEIGTSQTLTQSPLRINKRILCYLLNEPCLDDQLAGIVKPIHNIGERNFPLPPSHQKLAQQLIGTWSDRSATSSFPIVQLCGSEMSAKYSIAADACTRVGFNLNVMEASVLPTNPHELHHLIQRWFREALLTNSALFLNCDEVNQADAAREFAISQFIENSNSPLIVSSQERQHPRQRPLITFDVPSLTHSEQLAIWNSNLGTAAAELNGQVEALASQFNLSTPTIVAACLKVKAEMGKKQEEENYESLTQNPEQKIQSQLWDICRSMARPRLDDLAQRIESTASWSDLVLPEQQRQTIRDISAHVRQRAKVYEGWGFAGKGGRGLGISALFSGASGTGKTMAAEVIAQSLRLDLYRIDLSAVVSKYIGETEKNLRRIFDAAETGGAILLFDEADALFGKRTEVKDSHDRHANVEVSYLLQRMEAYQGLAILTTNLKGSLDQAFLRRIRFVIPFPFPDAKARTEIWMRIFPSRTPTQGLDMDKLGKLNVAGGNIRNIALNAAFLAADAGEAVMMKHILQAAKSEYLKLERSLTDAEVRGWVVE